MFPLEARCSAEEDECMVNMTEDVKPLQVKGMCNKTKLSATPDCHKKYEKRVFHANKPLVAQLAPQDTDGVFSTTSTANAPN
eukprot:4236073-Amphidinium_carterae.1